MRHPRAVAAPAGGTRWNRGSFICFSSQARGELPHPRPDARLDLARILLCTSRGFSKGEKEAWDNSPQCHRAGEQEIQNPAASRMLAQGLLIQAPAGLLGKTGQTDRQRQSWELQKSHMGLLFHFY